MTEPLLSYFTGFFILAVTAIAVATLISLSQLIKSLYFLYPAPYFKVVLIVPENHNSPAKTMCAQQTNFLTFKNIKTLKQNKLETKNNLRS